jgi:hypothetical protein
MYNIFENFVFLCVVKLMNILTYKVFENGIIVCDMYHTAVLETMAFQKIGRKEKMKIQDR